MSEWILISAIIVAVMIVIGLLLILVLFKKKKEGKMRTPNYKIFFILGLSWIPIGIVFLVTINTVLGIAFMGLGISYIAIGLTNRDKWETKED